MKTFNAPKVDVMKFEVADVITTSGDTNTGNDCDNLLEEDRD